MQRALLDAVTLHPSPRPKKRNSPYLVDILTADQPLLQLERVVDGRTLVVTVWDTQIDLHWLGPNGGQGDRLTLPAALLAELAAAI